MDIKKNETLSISISVCLRFEMNEFGSLRNNRLAAVRFRSESDFDKGIDLLLSKQEPFEVIGFDALIIPAVRLKRAEKNLRAAGLHFTELKLGSAPDLNRGQRALIRRERNTGSRKGLRKAS